MQNLDYQFCPMSLDEAWLAHDKRLVLRKAGNKHLIVKNRLIHARYGEFYITIGSIELDYILAYLLCN